MRTVEVTPEYLRSKGFTEGKSIFKEDTYGLFEREIENGWVGVEFPMNKWWVCHINQNGSHCGTIRHFKYVHQLEQFLNIYGIEL